MPIKTVQDLEGKVHHKLYKILATMKFKDLRPSQIKSLNSGLLDGKNLLVCTPTGSGKTLIAEIAAMHNVYNNIGKAIYIVPLKSLATEKYQLFREKYPDRKTALSIGDTDSSDTHLATYDIIVCTAEKLDSLIRHKAPWLRDVKVVVIDEIHLLNDSGRGPTLEILITILRHVLKNIQIIGLSATIGNPQELADWLDANLVEDSWRPVTLHHGTYLDGEIEFYK
jgi:helicase